MLNSLIGDSKRDLPPVLQSDDADHRGVTGWMMALGKLFSCAKRFAILLRLEDKDTSLTELAALLKTDPSNASRHLAILRKAEVVVERYVGFQRGPRKVFCLTLIGQKLLQGMREVALQVVRTQFKDIKEEPATRAQARAGRVTLNRVSFISLIEELEKCQAWRMLLGLQSESQYHIERQRLLKMASVAGVDLEWLRQMEQKKSGGTRL